MMVARWGGQLGKLGSWQTTAGTELHCILTSASSSVFNFPTSKYTMIDKLLKLTTQKLAVVQSKFIILTVFLASCFLYKLSFQCKQYTMNNRSDATSFHPHCFGDASTCEIHQKGEGCEVVTRLINKYGAMYTSMLQQIEQRSPGYFRLGHNSSTKIEKVQLRLQF